MSNYYQIPSNQQLIAANKGNLLGLIPLESRVYAEGNGNGVDFSIPTFQIPSTNIAPSNPNLYQSSGFNMYHPQ
jgi:hypothetical protein